MLLPQQYWYLSSTGTSAVLVHQQFWYLSSAGITTLPVTQQYWYLSDAGTSAMLVPQQFWYLRSAGTSAMLVCGGGVRCWCAAVVPQRCWRAVRSAYHDLLGVAGQEVVGRAAAPVDDVAVLTLTALTPAPVGQMQVVVDDRLTELTVLQQRVEERLQEIRDSGSTVMGQLHRAPAQRQHCHRAPAQRQHCHRGHSTETALPQGHRSDSTAIGQAHRATAQKQHCYRATT